MELYSWDVFSPHLCLSAIPPPPLPLVAAASASAVLVEVVQDACALLECQQPLELCAALKLVQDLAALVPRMERFIGDVCGVSSCFMLAWGGRVSRRMLIRGERAADKFTQG